MGGGKVPPFTSNLGPPFKKKGPPKFFLFFQAIYKQNKKKRNGFKEKTF